MNDAQSNKNNTATALRVRILIPGSGRGLQTDADLLQRALESVGCQVERMPVSVWSDAKAVWSFRYARIKRLIPDAVVRFLDRLQVRLLGVGKPRTDLQIHLESIAVEHLAAGKVNWIFPNQEWVRPQHLGFFRFIDRVLVKTEEGMRALSAHHGDIRMTGFSNPLAEVLPKADENLDRFSRFLHVAGRNRKKGSVPLVEAWRRHPEWPVLNMVIDDTQPLEPIPDNVKIWTHPSDEQLAQLRAENGIVLAPSEVEGYGHILLEGMAFSGLVVTTDAAPMNELIRPQRGMLMPWERKEPFDLGMRYFVNADAVEKAVTQILNTPPMVLRAKAQAGRNWVRFNHQAFLNNISQEIQELTGEECQRAGNGTTLLSSIEVH